MKNKYIGPNTVTYNSLLKSFDYDMEELQMYLQEMEALRLQFDIVTYSTLIQAYGHVFRNAHRMEMVYVQMKNVEFLLTSMFLTHY